MKRSLKLAIKKELPSSICASMGILSIIFSLFILTLDTGDYASFESYGGDAYTGMQNASAFAANNLVSLMQSLHIIGAAILFVIGGTIFSYFASKVYKTYMSDKCLVQVITPICQASNAAHAHVPNYEFCSKCGTQYDKNAGSCPNCSRQQGDM